MNIIINGQVNSSIAASDRGLAYGDGLFETIACVDGHLQFFSQHMQRLNEGCQRLSLPLIPQQQWLHDIRQLNIEQPAAVIKLMLTRGSGGRGYKIPQDAKLTRIVSVHSWPHYAPTLRQEGARLIVCRTPVSINPALAGLKHLNRLDNVLARAEWEDGDILEGLMLDTQGHVIEGTMSNLFAIEDQCLYTPSLAQAGVAGVIRQQLIALSAKLGYDCKIVPLSVKHLNNMDELFICNSLLGVCPVRQLEDKHFKQWPITSILQQQLNMNEASLAV